MGKRRRPDEGSERAEQNDSHSEAPAVQITDGEVGEGLQGGGDEGVGGPDCSCGKYGGPHLPPYKMARPVSTDIFHPTPRINVKNFKKSVLPFPDGMRYYTTISECQGTKKNGKPCDKKLIENMYLPLTRFELADGKNFKGKHTFQAFSSWTNPLPGHGPADFAREARTQVEGNRAWTKFWCAVHHLDGKLDSSPEPNEKKLIGWLQDKAKDFCASKSDFEAAGLLESGGPGDWEARVHKFVLAETLIKKHNLSSAPKLFDGKRNPEPTLATAASRSQTPSKSLRTDVRTQDRPFPASQGAAAGGPAQSASQQQCLPTPPPAGNGQAVMLSYSKSPMESAGKWWEDLVLSPLSSARIDSKDLADDGGRGGQEQSREEEALGGEGGAPRPAPPARPDNKLRGAFGGEALSPPQNPETVRPPLASPPPLPPHPPPAETIETPLELYPDQFRPMFLLLLNLMEDVQFREHANAERLAWAQFDAQELFDWDIFEQAEVHLAQRIGRYLHTSVLESPTLSQFYDDICSPGDALFEQFQHMLSAPPSSPATDRMFAAIYCFWRIQQELLHETYDTLRPPWSDTVKTSLQQILTKMQQGVSEEQTCVLLRGLFVTMDLEVRLGLEKLHIKFAHDYASRRIPTGSFAEVVWAPRIWCFFVMLRLRHDEDFSRTLWDTGVRFVGCDLDPTAAAPEKESWTQLVLSAGVLADGFGGGGGGGGDGGGVAGVAANPFTEDPNSPEMLVARLLKAEGREVDDEARAADGEVVAGLPLLSERVSKTRERMLLVYQGLPLIVRPPPPPPKEFVSLLSKLDSCRLVASLSLSEAIHRLGQETCDMIVKPRAVVIKGDGGGTRTRGGGVSRKRQSEETIGSEVERVWNDLHDFRDASGFWNSDWLLQVTVKQHDGNDDEEGKHIESSRITKGPNLRLYSVDPDLLIRVTIKNLSLTRDISFIPVYVEANEAEEHQDLVELKSGDDFELPIALRKEAGEEDDGWVIKDSMGKTVLKLRFTL